VDFVTGDAKRNYRCKEMGDCHFGEFCDTSTSPGKCLPTIPVGQRLGAPCSSESQVGHEQCGYIVRYSDLMLPQMRCTKKNKFETISKFQTLVCKWHDRVGGSYYAAPYESIEGQQCQNNIECGKDMICASTSPRVCSKPDTTHVGEGCDSSSECGRGGVCVCPTLGDNDGGRKRCSVSTSYETHNKEMDYYFTRLEMTRCSIMNKCITPHCQYKHCKSLFIKLGEYMRRDIWTEDVCSTPDTTAAYKGLDLSSSYSSTSSLLACSITAILSLYLSF